MIENGSIPTPTEFGTFVNTHYSGSYIKPYDPQSKQQNLSFLKDVFDNLKALREVGGNIDRCRFTADGKIIQLLSEEISPVNHSINLQNLVAFSEKVKQISHLLFEVSFVPFDCTIGNLHAALTQSKMALDKYEGEIETHEESSGIHEAAQALMEADYLSVMWAAKRSENRKIYSMDDKFMRTATVPAALLVGGVVSFIASIGGIFFGASNLITLSLMGGGLGAAVLAVILYVIFSAHHDTQKNEFINSRKSVYSPDFKEFFL